jgi:hypothetical protein
VKECADITGPLFSVLSVESGSEKAGSGSPGWPRANAAGVGVPCSSPSVGSFTYLCVSEILHFNRQDSIIKQRHTSGKRYLYVLT